jgi:hypothetical protein
MSEPRKLNSHATSSSIVTIIALAFFFWSSSRSWMILSLGDRPLVFVRIFKGGERKKLRLYTAIFLVEMENQRCRSCGSVLPYGIYKIFGQWNKFGTFGWQFFAQGFSISLERKKTWSTDSPSPIFSPNPRTSRDECRIDSNLGRRIQVLFIWRR